MSNLRKDLGTQKRKHLTSLVRKATKKRHWLRLQFDWDTSLYDNRLSCCNVGFIGHGNIFSLYTWTKKRKVKYFPLLRFNSVEVSLLDIKYERLANRVCSELLENGYEVGLTRDYTSRNTPFEIIYRNKK